MTPRSTTSRWARLSSRRTRTAATHGNLGAVSIGRGQTVCRSGRIPYTSHLKTYVFIANSHGYITYRSHDKKIY